MNQFLKKITYLIPFLLVLGGVNYFIDEQMVFHQERLDQAVESLQNEDTVYGISHVHRPYLHLQYAHQLEKPKDVLVIGASDCAQMGENIFSGLDVFSHWSPGSSIFFQLSVINEYEKRDMLPGHIVLALRPFTFSKLSPRPLKVISQPYGEMLDKLKLSEPTLDFTGPKILADNLKELFSAKYLVYNLKSEEHDIGVARTGNERFIMYPDGTVSNSFQYQSEIAEVTVRETTNFYIHALQNSQPELMHLHNKMIEYLQTKGVKITLYILPFHPKMLEDEAFAKANTKWEEYVQEIISKNNIELLGGPNPHDFGLTEEDFLDISHVKRSSIQKLFQKSPGLNPLQTAP